MMLIHEFLAFFSIIGYAAFLTSKKPRLSAFSSVLTISIIITILFLSGFVGLINETASILKIVGTGLFVWAAYQYKKKPHFARRSFAVFRGPILFLVFGLLWFVRTRGARVFGWDEFFWVCFSKVINLTSAYWDSHSAVLTSIQIRYLPGAPLWQSYFMAPGQYNEEGLFFAMGLLIFAGWSTLILMVRSLRRRLLVGYFTFFIFILFSPGITSLLLDQVIGVYFGIALIFCYYLERKRLSFMWLLPVLVSLLLFKEIALILLGTVLLVQATFILFRFSWKKALLFVLFCLCAVLPMKLWNEQLAKDPKIQTNVSSFNVKEAIDSIIFEKSETSQKIGSAFREALFTKKLFPVDIVAPSVRLFDTHFALTVFVLLVTFLGLKKLAWRPAQAALTTFSLAAGIVLYSLIILYFWSVVAAPIEGLQLMSYTRYFSSLFLGLILFSLFIITQILEKIPTLTKRWKVALGLFAIFTVTEPANWYGVKHSPKSIFKHSNSKLDRERVRASVEKVEALTPINARIWFLNQNSTGIELLIFRFEISPRTTNDFLHSLGKPYYKGDVWTVDLGPENIVQFSKDYGYLCINKGDEQLRTALTEVDPHMKTATFPGLFKIERDGDKVHFIQL